MTVSVVVPFRPDGAERSRNWAWLQRHLAAEHPGWEVVVAGCEGEWNKPAAVNRAARDASGSTLVISDADVFVTRQALEAAVARSAHAPWVVPHGETRRLTETSTLAVLGGADPRKQPKGPKPRIASAGGGLLVVPADAFWSVGGMDERFVGWGYEDAAFAFALDRLVGPHVRLDAPLFHLWHPPQPRPVAPKGQLCPNRVLYRRYLEADDLAELLKEP